jgi:hypothetical protein
VAATELGDEVGDIGGDGLPVGRRRLTAGSRENRAALVDDAPRNLGAADVDTDREPQ